MIPSPLEIPDDTAQLKAMLAEAHARLQRVVESEKAAHAEIDSLRLRLNGSAKPTELPEPSYTPRPPHHKPLGDPTEFCGQSPPMQRVVRLCTEVAHTDASVILTGETGVGKEVAARVIHRVSHRGAYPFVAVNCAALPETLLESELFGHEKGAFTGATQRKPGHFEMAKGGTLLLDEIGEMPLPMQAKLLRVLEQRCFLRVGGVQLIHCDVRIIAATNRDLKGEIKAGRFRSDLYYRLNVFPIDLPPLRDRHGDLPLLIDTIAHRYARQSGIPFAGLSEGAMAYLLQHTWPGNIRELRNVIERCMILARERPIEPQDLPAEIIVSVSDPTAGSSPEGKPPPLAHSRIAASERAMVVEALLATGWNKAAAARQLGISWDNLRYRIKKYNLKRPG